MEWEERLMEEMCRLTSELEQVHLEERNKALDKQKGENFIEFQSLISKQKQAELKLLEEVRKELLKILKLFPPTINTFLSHQIQSCKSELDRKQEELRETQTKADMQLLEHRAYLDRKEREFQRDLDKQERELERQERIHSDLIGKMSHLGLVTERTSSQNTRREE